MGGYNTSGLCELVEGIHSPWTWKNGRQVCLVLVLVMLFPLEFRWKSVSDFDPYSMDKLTLPHRSQPSGLDTVFEANVNCTEWIYNIPVLEPIAGTPFIRGRHMAYIISYCDVLYSLLILYGVSKLRKKVLAAKDRLEDEIVQVRS